MSALNMPDAFQFKKQGNGEFSNVVIDGYGNYTENATVYSGAAIKIQDAMTNADQVNNSKIKVLNAKITNTTEQAIGATGSIVVSFPSGNFTTSNAATGASIDTGNWVNVNGLNLLQ